MITLPDKRIECLKALYEEAKEEYSKWRELHDGQWHTGSPAGLDDMLILEKAIAILVSSEEKAEELKAMDSLKIRRYIVDEKLL